MSNNSQKHNQKLETMKRRYKTAIFGLLAGAVATILAWILLSIDLMNHNDFTKSGVFALVMTLIFIVNIFAFDSTKKKLLKYPGMGKATARLSKSEKAQEKLAKQKKKGKAY